jgi:peptidylprolyl isomerase
LSLFRRNGRRPLHAAVAIAGVLLLTLTACGSSSKSPSTKEVTPAGSALFPTVSGSYGTKPTLTFPKNKPSTALQVKVLSTGTGATVVKSNLIVVDYLGQIWQGKAFDNSYDTKSPLGTPIGVNQVIKGWDQALVGKKVGSRVLMVVPPALAYGTTGNTNAGIKPTDTLAFVVDIIAQYSKSNVGDKKAVLTKAATAPVTVTGALGAQPKIVVAKGTAVPKAAKTVLIAKSTGAKITAGLVVLQYQAVYYSGEVADSTFVRGQPQAATVGTSTATAVNPFDGLIGQTIGSRVLITTPGQTADGKTAGIAIVADIIAEVPPAKAS